MLNDTRAPITATRDPHRPFHPIGTLATDPEIVFLGKRYPHGFGLDLPFAAERVLLATIANLPPQRIAPFLGFNGHHDFRERYAADTIRWFGRSGLPLDDVQLNRIHPLLDFLRSQQVWDGLTFAHVTQQRSQTGTFELPPLPIVTRWRHFSFADVIVGDRLHHLRTTEMLAPGAVWDRLWSLFVDYYSFLEQRNLHHLKTSRRQQEERNFCLALYERLLFLCYEEATQQPRYRAAITDRHAWPSLDQDHILPINGPLTDWPSLGRARHAREIAYRELLRALLHQTLDQLCPAAPSPIHS